MYIFLHFDVIPFSFICFILDYYKPLTNLENSERSFSSIQKKPGKIFRKKNCLVKI